MTTAEHWFQILGVRPDASALEVEAAWRDRMRVCHPDKPTGSEAAAQRLNWARDESKKR